MLSWVCPPTASARSATIRNIPPPHLAPSGTSLTDIAGAIRTAVEIADRKVTGESLGIIVASLRIRTHEAIVSIGFDEQNYWIDYRDSVNTDRRPSSWKIRYALPLRALRDECFPSAAFGQVGDWSYETLHGVQNPEESCDMTS
jgi:hypothetical protein